MRNRQLKDFYDRQIDCWELARNNIRALSSVKRKPFQLGELQGYIQFNPARAVSTLANVDKASVEKRPCFLCHSNRPPEQHILNILPGWEVLVNPFPILPYHFTIANCDHTPQRFSIETGVALAEKLPGMVVFFNDDGAGASAPDHLHYQAVPLESLPLVSLLEKKYNPDIPFKIFTDREEILRSEYPVNAYFWKSDRDGKVKFAVVPRRAHRPAQFYLEPPTRRAFSPGAIDMTGIAVTPVEEDFNAVTSEDIRDIYSQVAFQND